MQIEDLQKITYYIAYHSQTSFLKALHDKTNLLKCDVICKNLPYGGTKAANLDQLFSHVCSICGKNCTGRDKNVCCRCSWVTNIVDPDLSQDAAHYVWCLVRVYNFYLSIRQVFADDVTSLKWVSSSFKIHSIRSKVVNFIV